MSYVSGGALATPRALLDQIQTAALAAGWTLTSRGSTGVGDYQGDVLWLFNGTSYSGFAFKNADSASSEVYAYHALAHDGTTATGVSNTLTNYAYAPCVGYHVFASSNSIYVVLEGKIGHYRHFGVGLMDKFDSYEGGGFTYGHRSSASGTISYAAWPFERQTSSGTPSSWGTFSVMVAGDGYPQRARYNNWDNKAFPNGCLGGTRFSPALTHEAANNFGQPNKQTILTRIYCSVLRIGGFYSPIGTPPNIRYCRNSFTADEEIISLGVDDWKIFPIGRRVSSQTAFNSAGYAFAYLIP